ncbi:MAG: hypothetical protein LBM61_06395 [Prevotellaceae bacterium]|jgi:PAS domain-containing protein|nr:hypothetical protein [Prevotellaceae bacterium]
MTKTIALEILFFLAISVSGFAQETSVAVGRQTHVLIVSSGSYGDEWTRTLVKSIQEAIKERDPSVSLSESFASVAESRSLIADLLSMQAAFMSGQRKDSADVLPDLLILVGDEAWMYYGMMKKHHLLTQMGGVYSPAMVDILNNLPVVLVDCRPELLRNPENWFNRGFSYTPGAFVFTENTFNGLPVTALMRREDDSPTIGLVRALNPKVKELIFLSTGNYADGYALYKLQSRVMRQYPEFHLQVWDANPPTETQRQELADRLKRLSKKESAVLVYSAPVPECTAPVFLLNDRSYEGRQVVGGVYPLVTSFAIPAAEAVLRILDGEEAFSIPSRVVEYDTNLNEEALEYYGWTNEAEMLDDVVIRDRNISFWETHIRLFIVIAMVLIGLLFSYLLYRSNARYRRNLRASLQLLQRKYDEFSMVYENMPMIMAHFNSEGKMIDASPHSEQLLRQLCGTPDGIHLFSSGLLSRDRRRYVVNKQQLSKEVQVGERTYSLILYVLPKETTENEQSPAYLLIVTDHTELRKEEQLRQEYQHVFLEALDMANIGICQYNFCTKKVFANDVWFKQLCLADHDLSKIYEHMVPEDATLLQTFVNDVVEGKAFTFDKIVRVTDGLDLYNRWLILTVEEYAPAEERIVSLGISLDMDAQVRREEELADSLAHAAEADRLKNAFIANVSRQIHPSMESLIHLSSQITMATTKEEREELLVKIQHYNDMLLNYIKQIIKLSREDEEERGLGI